MKKIVTKNEKKKDGRVLGRKLAREVSVEELKSAAGGFYTNHGDSSSPIHGSDYD
jgi:hypothetical protein